MDAFGEKLNGVTYIRRPGVYAVLVNEEGMIGVVETPKGFFLVGGGIDEDEDPEEALKREAIEETGMEIEILGEIGEATDHAYIPEFNDYYSKEGKFYEARVLEKVTDPIEDDHKFKWLPKEDAIEKMYYGSQRWAIEESNKRKI